MKIIEIIESPKPEEILTKIKSKDPESIEFAQSVGLPPAVINQYQELGSKISDLRTKELDDKQHDELFDLTSAYRQVEQGILNFLKNSEKGLSVPFSRRRLFTGGAKALAFAARLPTLIQAADKLAAVQPAMDLEHKLALALIDLKKRVDVPSIVADFTTNFYPWIEAAAKKYGVTFEQLNDYSISPDSGFFGWLESSEINFFKKPLSKEIVSKFEQNGLNGEETIKIRATDALELELKRKHVWKAIKRDLFKPDSTPVIETLYGKIAFDHVSSNGEVIFKVYFRQIGIGDLSFKEICDLPWGNEEQMKKEIEKHGPPNIDGLLNYVKTMPSRKKDDPAWQSSAIIHLPVKPYDPNYRGEGQYIRITRNRDSYEGYLERGAGGDYLKPMNFDQVKQLIINQISKYGWQGVSIF